MRLTVEVTLRETTDERCVDPIVSNWLVGSELCWFRSAAHLGLR